MIRTSHCAAKNLSWSVCATAREDPQLLQKFVEHHKAIGASQIHLYLDRPEEDVIAWAKQQTTADVTICDEAYHRARTDQISNHLQLQVANFQCFLQEKCRTDWTVHIDADEFISSERSITALLGELGSDYDSLQVMPVEPVFKLGPTSSMQAHHQALARLPVLSMSNPVTRFLGNVYGENATFLRRALVGHALGKTFIRRSAQLSELHLHHTRAAAPERHMVADKFILRLLHYDAVDFAHFKRKMSSRMAMSTGNMGGGREQLVDKFRAVAGSDNHRGTTHLFNSLYTLDKRQMDLLESKYLLVRLEATRMEFASGSRPWVLACGPQSTADAYYYARLGYAVSCLRPNDLMD